MDKIRIIPSCVLQRFLHTTQCNIGLFRVGDRYDILFIDKSTEKREARKESLHGHSTWTSDPLSGRLVLGKDGIQVEIVSEPGNCCPLLFNLFQ